MRTVVAFLFLSTSWPVLAATESSGSAAPTEPGGVEAEEIIVTGTRAPRGSVIGDITPEVTLSAEDIGAYGVSDLGELLAELTPLTGSMQGRGGGQPIVLLGGRRISSFREIRDLPPEAVMRVDILPEEVALKYGYRADQKVVNFVLRPNFEAVTTRLETIQATAGGRQNYEGDVNYLRIVEGSRLSINAEYLHKTPLFEDERSLVSPDPDRTLLAASDAAKLDGTYNRTLFGNVAATLNLALDGEDVRASLGRARDGSQRLLRDRQSRNANLGYALNGDVAGWRWSLNGGYSRSRSSTFTDRDIGGGIGRDRARSVSETLETEATASGDLFRLPAGAVAATIKTGFNLRDIASESTRGGLRADTALSRDQASAQLNLDLPLLKGGTLGALSVNANGLAERLSDFGTLTTLAYGFNWKPADEIRLIGSVTHEEGAPGIQQLGNPVLATPNVRVFDITTGQTVDITRIEGGNPDLLADKRRVMKLGLTLKPIGDTDLTLLANYTDARTDNLVASFPTATPEIEAAFPSRFERDADGVLLRIDSRPVNFERASKRQLRWGFDWSERLGGPPPRRGPDGRPRAGDGGGEPQRQRVVAGGARGAGEGGPGAVRWGAGGGGRSMAGGRSNRLTLSLFHTWRLEDTILIRPGVPKLDLLDGSATGDSGGQPRHEVQMRAGYSRNGLGARLHIDWQEATHVRSDPASAPSSAQDLRFGALTTVDLRLFADLGRQEALLRAAPFFRGSRLTLAVDNLFEERRDVRDGTGAVPLGYQPALIDPLGRSVRLSFRKLFS